MRQVDLVSEMLFAVALFYMFLDSHNMSATKPTISVNNYLYVYLYVSVELP